MSAKQIATATVVVLAIVALAALSYLLIDILLLVFLGIVVAAALQPWHERLCRLGVPKGAAVLLIYLLFLTGLVALGILVAPVVADEISAFGASLPDAYTRVRSTLAESQMAPVRMIAERLPPFERLAQGLEGVSSSVFQGLFGLTSTVVGVVAYLLSILALYGVLGVFLAIPLAAVIQVLLDRILINVEPVTEVATGPGSSPWEELGARVQGLRQHVRARLRARDTRMGIDPASADHVVDAQDQQIEGAVERVEKMITVAKDSGAAMAPAEHAALVERIQDAAHDIERAGGDACESSVTPEREPAEPRETTIEIPLASPSPVADQVGGGVERVEHVITTTRESPGPIEGAERTTIVERLDEATRQIKGAVEEVDSLVAAARDPSIPSAEDERENTAQPATRDEGSTTETRLHGEQRS